MSEYIGKAHDGYVNDIKGLVEGSKRRHFDPYQDIPWDDPDYEINDSDPRLVIPPTIDLGKTDWYQGLPEKEQTRIARRRFSDVQKVGLQFERMLVQAIMVDNVNQPSSSIDREYSDIEAREELNHILMFEECIKALGVETKGASVWFRKLLPLIIPAAGMVRGGMWAIVLAGEEPIDHMQKEFLRDGENMHPLIRDIMAIHVAEEGRHISYAHRRLAEDVPKMGRLNKSLLAVGMPAAMRILGDVIVIPSSDAIKDMDVPEVVADEVWGSKTKSARQARANQFTDARMLAENIGLKSKDGEKRTAISTLGDIAWKAFRIDGRASRYRSEPNRTHIAV